MNARINREQMPYAEGPFSYELIEARQSGKYRIRDRHDNAVGSAETEDDARAEVRRLNRKE